MSMSTVKAPQPAAPRRQQGWLRRPLSPAWSYRLAAGIVGLSLFAAGVPSPLYGRYQALWHFSPAVLTLVYASYAFGVLGALVLAGRVSDEIGRRPILLTALGGITVATVIYMLARSVVWLFFARGLQGAATGLALSPASAALLDLHPRRDPIGAGLTNGVASAGGLGFGLLVSSIFDQYLPAPRVLPYVLLLVFLIIAIAGTLRFRDPEREDGTVRRFRLTPQRPAVPSEIRHPFLLSSLAVLASWSVNGLYLSLGPTIGKNLLHTQSMLWTGLVVSCLFLSGAVAMIIFGRISDWLQVTCGAIALAVGMGLMIAATSIGSGALFVLATLTAGPGFGLAFLGGLRSLSARIPTHHRAGVLSAFYLVCYSALSLPAIAAGLLVTPVGLDTTFEIFGVAIAAIAIAVAGESWRTHARSSPAAQ